MTTSASCPFIDILYGRKAPLGARFDMAAVLTFRYRNFSVICSALPHPSGGFTGKAQVQAGDGMIRHHEVETLKDHIHSNEQLALDAASEMAREWIDSEQS